jgi:spermidine/putrescine transport system substrate-binding protein
MVHSLVLAALSILAMTSLQASPYMESHPLAEIAIKAAEGSPSSVTLYVHNSEDYIANGSDDSRDIIADFKKYVKDTDNVDITVVYSNFSTMEDELSKLQTGGTTADLVCVSDYIIQRMMSLNMVIPFKSGAERTALYGSRATGWADNYSLYASKFLQNELSAIHATINGQDGSLGEYARGYMWGTLGVTYNPNFSAYAARGLSREDVMVQMNDWNALWSGNYNQTFQVKDSMRDTYSIGLMHVYDDYFKQLLSWYKAGKDSTGAAYDKAAYNADVSTIFNNVNHLDAFNALAKKIDANAVAVNEKEIVDKVQEALIQLKEDSFGLEVDSGKTDIISGDKSGIDTAWSGDAVTSLNNADAIGNALYYSIPKTGGNIWFDAWVLINRTDIDDAQKAIQQEYAQKFIDFISEPQVAADNMNYIGYTSFVAGNNILSLVRDWYDVRIAAMYVYDDKAGDFFYDDNGNKVYKDGTGKHEDSGLDYGDHNMTGSTLDHPVVDTTATTWDDYEKAYRGEDENPWVKSDLSYFFGGSLTDEMANDDCKVYTNEIEEVTGKNLAGEEETVLVGRQFLAQYPSDMEDNKGTVLCQIPGLAVMEDYKNNNAYILFMWENVKSSGAIKPWIVILLSVEVATALGIGLYIFFKNRGGKALRKRRREEMQAAQASSAADPKHNAPKLR